MIDIFGEKEQKNLLLRDKYIEPPFSVLDTKTGHWQRRRQMWKNLGIKSEVGRNADLWGSTNSSFNKKEFGLEKSKPMANESIFDPVICELMYTWFADGEVLDPFSGGSVRGIVSNYLGFPYTGIDIRKEQVDSNILQAKEILENNNQPRWIIGDSNKVLDDLTLEEYGFVFSCPPYADLEVYSDLEGDISNLKYKDFIIPYRSIIKKSCEPLKNGCFACFVVGEVRDKKTGSYYGFIPDTIKAFTDCGMEYYNEIILLNSVGTARLRVGNTFDKGDGKVVKVHQNILIFRKP
jgi:hypothetical protein